MSIKQATVVLYVIIYQSTHYKETIVCMIIHCWYCIGLTKSSFGFFQTILWKNLNNFLVNSIYFMGFWQLIHIHHYGIIQSILTTLKILFYLHLPPPPLQALATLLMSPQFCFFHNVIPLDSSSIQPFQTGFFQSIKCI